VSESFRRRKDGEDWALEMERNIDRDGAPKPRVVRMFANLAILSTCTKTSARLQSPLAGQKPL